MSRGTSALPRLRKLDEITSSESSRPEATAGDDARDYSPEEDLEDLHNLNDTVYHLRFRSSPRAFGGLITVLKRGLRRLLTPILVRQLRINAAATRLIVHAIGADGRMRDETTAMIASLRVDLAAMIAEAGQEQATMTDVYRVSLGRRIDNVSERGAVELERAEARLTERIDALSAQQEQIVQVLERLARGGVGARTGNGEG